MSIIRYNGRISSPVFSQVEAYWEGLRNGRLVPARSDIDPRGIQSALDFAFILERIAPGAARVRIAGRHMSELMGMEVRGLPVSAMFAPAARDQLAKALEHVCDNPSIVELSITADRGFGKPVLDGKMMLLPLTSDLGDVDRVLGCLMTEGEIGRQPRRFTIVGARQRRILQAAKPSIPAPAPAKPVAVPAFAEARHEFKPAPRPKGPVPYLRLVKSDS